jgi:hypothetical protein
MDSGIILFRISFVFNNCKLLYYYQGVVGFLAEEMGYMLESPDASTDSGYTKKVKILFVCLLFFCGGNYQVFGQHHREQ